MEDVNFEYLRGISRCFSYHDKKKTILAYKVNTLYMISRNYAEKSHELIKKNDDFVLQTLLIWSVSEFEHMFFTWSIRNILFCRIQHGFPKALTTALKFPKAP